MARHRPPRTRGGYDNGIDAGRIGVECLAAPAALRRARTLRGIHGEHQAQKWLRSEPGSGRMRAGALRARPRRPHDPAMAASLAVAGGHACRHRALARAGCGRGGGGAGPARFVHYLPCAERALSSDCHKQLFLAECIHASVIGLGVSSDSAVRSPTTDRVYPPTVTGHPELGLSFERPSWALFFHAYQWAVDHGSASKLLTTKL